MDSRIEELATIIKERASSTADLLQDRSDRGDVYHSYRSLETLASNMLRVIKEYRTDHPKEYEDPPKRPIAAAPYLLEALVEAEAALDWVIEQAGGPACEHDGAVCFCRENTAINTVRAAIDKAMGVQP